MVTLGILTTLALKFMKRPDRCILLISTLFLFVSSIAQTTLQKQALEDEIALEFKKYDQPKIDALTTYLFVSKDESNLNYSKKKSLQKIKTIKASNYDFSSTQKDINILKGIYVYGMQNKEYQVVEKLFEYMHNTNNILSVNQHDMHALYAYLYFKQGKKELLKDFLSRLSENDSTIMKEHNTTLPNYQAILAYRKLLDGDINACDDLISMSIISDSNSSTHTIRFRDNSKRDLLLPFCGDYMEHIKKRYTNTAEDVTVEIDKTSSIFNKKTGEIYKKKITGKIIKVISGDRFVIREDLTKQELTLKIMAIDAPKKGEFMAEEAYRFTTNEIFNKDVTVTLVMYAIKRGGWFGAIVQYRHVKSSEKYKNDPNSTVQIGNLVIAEDRYLNLEILKHGFAKAQDHVKVSLLLDAQEEAKKNKLGIWSKSETNK